eukprot:augustus_masked-scaffold_60-processed-gene-0.71-mRNA-1 protein AED:0.69 eAED:0.69 QI:0/-1/0/1/-1/1/1/0/2071
MFEEILLKQQEESQRRMEAMLNNFAGMQAEISILESFTLRSMEKFIYQYERINEDQRKYVMLRQKLGKLVYKQMECLGCLGSNDEIINAIKKKIVRLKVEDAGSAEGLIRKQVVFKKEMDEEEAVEVLFQEVEEVLSLLPPESRRKPRKIAKAIFDLLPKHIWVRYDDLNLKPELEEADRQELKKYILSCIPPRHVRKEFKVFCADKIKSTKQHPVASRKQKYEIKSAQMPKDQGQLPKGNELLCEHDWIYGHTQRFCYEKKAGKPALPYPGLDEMQRRLARYKERKKEKLYEVTKSASIKKEEDKVEDMAKEYFGSKMFRAVGGCPNKFFGGKKDTEIGSVKLNEVKSVINSSKVFHDDGFYKIKAVKDNAFVDSYLSGKKLKCLLDSGAFRSALNSKHKKLCDGIKQLERPVRVQAAGGVIYPVHEVGFLGKMWVESDKPELEPLVFEEVEVLILEVPEWDDLIIGNDVLCRYGLDPLSAMENKMKVKGKTKTNFAKWFVSNVGVEDEAARDIEIKEIYPSNEKSIPPQVFGWDWPNEEEFLDIENIDLGAGAEVTDIEKDNERMRNIIREKLENIPVVNFDDSLAWKRKFTGLFLQHAQTFGDSNSYTKLSKITPIRCDIIEGAQVGVQKQLPLGQEQEDFLHARINHMVKAGIIQVNKNPTTAMSVLVVPKKGPKRFRLVVDFRPLNRVTKKVSNTLPKIELQLDRVKGNAHFCGFDLLSGFDYLACKEQAGEFFTFTTPWGVSYSFLGAPQGWCNTPSLFSMRQIEEVLMPSGLWPRKAMQWIDDSIIMGGTMEELYDNTSRFLTQIQKKELRLNVEKCELVADKLTFCGREVNKDGWSFDNSYAKGLLERVKPIYLHELAQLIYTANFISATIPGFSKIRKLLLGSHKITGKMKNLERRRVPIEWTEEMERTYEEMMQALKDSMSYSLGFYDPKEDVYLFTDASERFYSLYISQTSEKVDRLNPFLSNFRVIAMSSGSFVGSALNWHISCKELFPVLMAVKKFPYYLKYNAKEKVLFTDHKNLVQILNPREAKLKSHTSRLNRWAMEFMELNLVACHLDGYQNIPADCLSRWLNPKYHKTEADLEVICKAISRANSRDTELDFWRAVDMLHVSPRHPASLNLADVGWEVIDEVLLFNLQKRDLGESLEELKKEKEKIFVTKSMIPVLILHAHMWFNHGSKANEVKLLKDSYYFEAGIWALVVEAHKVFRRQCMHCQKPSLVVRRTFNITEWGSRSGEVLLADFLYINSTGWILTLVDSLTRTTILRYCKKATADNLVSILWDWNSHFQLRDDFILVTDKGSHFTSNVVEKFLRESGCSHKFTATYVSYTAGAVEVQNRQILRHLRSIVSEFGLGNNGWPDVLPMVQAFINQTPLTCRGLRMSPLELMIGVEGKNNKLGSVYKNMEKKDFQRLKEAAIKLREELHKLQEKASSCGLEYRMKANLRRNAKLTSIFFRPGEFVWMSEKEVNSGNKDKVKPRWCGPYQIREMISEHLYKLEDLNGNVKVRHSTLLIPFAPVGFLPNPATKLVYRMNRGDLEVEKFVRLIKDVEGNLSFEVKWRGFPTSDNTFEPVTIMFEDLPSLVNQFIRDNPGVLSKELYQYLKVMYPDAFEEEVSGSLNSLYAMSEKEESSYVKKLIYGKVVINELGQWNYLNWSTYEVEALRFGVLNHGFGDFIALKKYVPGKNKQQVYTKLQKLVGRQSLKVYHGLYLDVDVLRVDNLRMTGEEYCVRRIPRDSKQVRMFEVLIKWKYATQHIKNFKKAKEKKLKVFNLTNTEGVKMMLEYVKQEDSSLDDCFPKFVGGKESFLLFLKQLWSDLRKREKDIEGKLEEVKESLCENYIFPMRNAEYEVRKCDTPNLVKVDFKELNCVAYIWNTEGVGRFYKGDVRCFLTETQKKFDVLIVDPPWRVFSGDPVRGPAVSYSTLSDDEILKLNLKAVMHNTLCCVWVIKGKENIVQELFHRNGIRMMGRFIWIKTNGHNKILSTLGNLTMRCTEECILGVKGELPKVLVTRSLGKEILYGKRTGNAQKPVELYELLENSCQKETRFLELFGRKNNLRKNWFTVGNEL